VLINREQNLWNLGLRVDLKLLFDVLRATLKRDGPAHCIFDDIRLRRNAQLKSENGHIITPLLFFKLGVDVEKKILR